MEIKKNIFYVKYVQLTEDIDYKTKEINHLKKSLEKTKRLIKKRTNNNITILLTKLKFKEKNILYLERQKEVLQKSLKRFITKYPELGI